MLLRGAGRTRPCATWARTTSTCRPSASILRRRTTLPVLRYVHPDTFKRFEEEAYKMGFTYVAVGAMVRSSTTPTRRIRQFRANAGAD